MFEFQRAGLNICTWSFASLRFHRDNNVRLGNNATGCLQELTPVVVPPTFAIVLIMFEFQRLVWIYVHDLSLLYDFIATTMYVLGNNAAGCLEESSPPSRSYEILDLCRFFVPRNVWHGHGRPCILFVFFYSCLFLSRNQCLLIFLTCSLHLLHALVMAY